MNDQMRQTIIDSIREIRSKEEYPRILVSWRVSRTRPTSIIIGHARRSGLQG